MGGSREKKGEEISRERSERGREEKEGGRKRGNIEYLVL